MGTSISASAICIECMMRLCIVICQNGLGDTRGRVEANGGTTHVNLIGRHDW